MIDVGPLAFDDIYAHPDFGALTDEYADECAMAGLPRPSGQWDMYRAMEDAGLLHMLGAFNDERMSGFLFMLVSVLPHYGAMVAVTESFFVASDQRTTGAGTKLLREGERLATDLGAVGILVSAPADGKLSKVMRYSEYTPTNEVFFKALQ